MKYGERLREARKLRNLTQDGLAERAGVKQGTISKIERGDQGPSSFDAQLADALQISAIWLSKEKGKMLSKCEAEPARIPEGVRESYGNVTEQTTALVIPLVISGLHEASRKPPKEQLSVPNAFPIRYSERAYAVRIEGDAMTSPQGRTYPPGCWIIVDPDQVQNVVSGDRVIAEADGDPTPIFRQYVEEGGRCYLKALNPSDLPIEGAFTITGKVILKLEE